MGETSFTAKERQRYARHLALADIGEAGQRRLAASAVLIVGAGGLGSPAALYLAAAGVGRIGLVDHDQVELSNLQRQVLFSTPDVGAGKAEAGGARLATLNPGIIVDTHTVKFGPRNAMELARPYDLVLDGTDRLALRYLINDTCVLLGKPMVSAAIHRFEGQAMTYLPGRGPCYRCLYPAADDALVPNCAEAGVLGVLPGVMGTLQATEALKVLLGIGEPLVGRLLVYDALAMDFQQFAFTRRADCAVCGELPTITTIETSGEDAMIEEWTAEELTERLADAHAKPVVLVDVREPHEWADGYIEGSMHIPLGSLATRAAEIPEDQTPVFICAVGGRSMAACRYFASIGRPAVNLAGGVVGWSARFGALPRPE